MRRFSPICVFIFYLACTTQSALAARPLQVTVSILPQVYFVNQIAGNLARVSVMVLPGAGPATYEPKPNQMEALASSKLYFSIGVPFEKTWLPKIHAANPAMRIIPTQEGIQKIPMAHNILGSKPNPPRERHGQEILDPHIWLAPPLVKIQARHIKDALCTADPTHAALFTQNFRTFIHNLDRLDQQIRSLLGPDAKGRHFVVFHPAWGYFAGTYGLIQVPVEIEGKSPSPRFLAQLIDMANSRNIRTIFVQPQFSKRSASVIAKAIHGKIVRLDPLAPKWAENLLAATRIIKGVLR